MRSTTWFLLVFQIIAITRVLAQNTVNLQLKGSFNAVPLLLQAQEFIYAQDKPAFFSSLYITATKSDLSPPELITFISNHHKDFMQHDDQFESMLSLSLSLNEYAPLVAAHYQYYNQYHSTIDCPVWALYKNQTFCDLKEFKAMVQDNDDEKSEIQHLPFDHIYKRSVAYTDTVVLYADIGHPDFGQWHYLLMTIDVTYVLRYRPATATTTTGKDQLIGLSGYGVELQMKNTEYSVSDDREIEEALDNQTNEGVGDLDLVLDSTPPTIFQVKEDSEVKTLGLQVSKYILKKEEQVDRLNALENISQNFPRYAHLIAKLDLEETLLNRKDVQHNQMSLLRHDEDKLWVNGVEVDLFRFDMFKLLRMLKKESRLFQSFSRMGLKPSTVRTLLRPTDDDSSGSSHDLGDLFDIRDPLIVWLNNLEKDSRYQHFTPNMNELLRPLYPGQLHQIKRNLFNVIYTVDLTNPNHLQYIEQGLVFIKREIPFRFGLVQIVDPTNHDDPSHLMALAVEQCRKKLSKLQSFVTDLTRRVGEKDRANKLDIRSSFKKSCNSDGIDESSSSNKDFFDKVVDYSQRTGVDYKSGALFFNGRYIELDGEYQRSLLESSHYMTKVLQKALYKKEIDSKTNIFDYFMKLDGVYTRRNSYLVKNKQYFDLSHTEVDDLTFIYPSSMSDNRTPILHTFIVVADFDNIDGLKLAYQVLKYISKRDNDCRVSFISSHLDHKTDSVPNLAYALSRMEYEESISFLMGAVENAIEKETTSMRYESDAYFVDHQRVLTQLEVDGTEKLDSDSTFAMEVLDVGKGDRNLLYNGRDIGSFENGVGFTEGDIEALVNMEAKKVQSIVDVLSPDGSDIVASANAVQKAVSVLNVALDQGDDKAGKRTNMEFIENWLGGYIKINDSPLEDCILDIVAVLDPISENAQRLSRVLNVLKDINSTFVRVLLNPKLEMEKVPLKRFYRYVLNSKPVESPRAYFTRIPQDPLLTLGMDVIGPWIVNPVESKYDLDNIVLKAGNVDATFQLKHILVQGHARESNSQGPPRGLQFILGTRQVKNLVDTITMANLGYIQLKANPGLWELRIREGRSRDIYEFESVLDKFDNSLVENIQDDYKVLVASFEGVTIYPIVKRRPGREHDDVLDMDESSSSSKDAFDGDSGSSIWDSVKSAIFGSEKDTTLESDSDKTEEEATMRQKNADINIFTVASGHLYERFLSIMMLSVMKNTNSTVKFWLIEEFLSPSFKDFVPILAKELNFRFEFVGFKWPHWLRHQTEKQRTIWGHKILFLDVLFPLTLDRVIFVDADQVVRADMKELVDMDLNGAVYGYTPFCDSRKEIEGFRFWKQGYWASHLQGKPYHISALYVVDLKRFRQVAAGDRIRQQYQMLSADENSLSNLDQDLPNNMIHQVPIFSLPQDWLWCETWCSDSSLETAKTIDLCNNPMTKEPKLDRAKRILPEWEQLDNEVSEIRDRMRETVSTPSAAESTSTTEDGADSSSEEKRHDEL